MPRGGVRQGTPGNQYPNRSDLSRPLPPSASPGGEYGDKIASLRAQQAVPMAPAPSPVATAAPTTAPAPPSAPPVPLDAPSQRPAEPVTAGLPVGAGPGTEALGVAVMGGQRLADVIAQAANLSGSSDLAFLAQRARNLGQ